MPYVQVQNILKRAIDFHKMLEGFYSKMEKTSKKESVKLLVDYMARHEKVLENHLIDITEEQHNHLKNEWIKYDPEYAAYRCFENLNIREDSSVDDVINTGLRLNQCLVNLYGQMAEISPTQELKTLFSNLETLEIAEKKKLASCFGM